MSRYGMLGGLRQAKELRACLGESSSGPSWQLWRSLALLCLAVEVQKQRGLPHRYRREGTGAVGPEIDLQSTRKDEMWSAGMQSQTVEPIESPSVAEKAVPYRETSCGRLGRTRMVPRPRRQLRMEQSV